MRSSHCMLPLSGLRLLLHNNGQQLVRRLRDRMACGVDQQARGDGNSRAGTAGGRQTAGGGAGERGPTTAVPMAGTAVPGTALQAAGGGGMGSGRRWQGAVRTPPAQLGPERSLSAWVGLVVITPPRTSTGSSNRTISWR